MQAGGSDYGTFENPIRLDDLWNGKEYTIHMKKGVEAFYVFETPSAKKIKDTKGYFCLRVKPTEEYFESIDDRQYRSYGDSFHWNELYMRPLGYTDAYIGTKEEMAEKLEKTWLYWNLGVTGWRKNAVAYKPSTTYYLWFCGSEYQEEMDLRFWLDFPGEDSEGSGLATPVQLSEVVNGSIHDYYDDAGTENRGDEVWRDYTHHDCDNFQITIKANGNYTFEVGNTGDLMGLEVLIYEMTGAMMDVQERFIVKKGSTVKIVFKLKKGHTYYLEVHVEKSYLEPHEYESSWDNGMEIEDAIYVWDERDCLNDQKYWFSITRHNYELKNTVAPTAIKLGYSDYVCKDCGEKFRDYKAPTGPLKIKSKGSTDDVE